jgi:hypothetical protein
MMLAGATRMGCGPGRLLFAVHRDAESAFEGVSFNV